jgi:hypothetical protein
MTRRARYEKANQARRWQPHARTRRLLKHVRAKLTSAPPVTAKRVSGR